jgi:glycine dehydrogenase subunit 1
MAARITGKRKLILPGNINADKLSKIHEYLKPDLQITRLPYRRMDGLMELEALRTKIDGDTAAVYIENPTYLGTIETQVEEITQAAHAAGALCVVSVDPLSLGVLKSPIEYGADIACGDIQTLGMHMNYGGGHGGFIATGDIPEFVMEFPSRLFGVAATTMEGEYGFGDVAYERTSFAMREEGKEWVGTAAALWGITAGVYLALMGPQGMVEIGEGIMRRCRYAMQQIARVKGVRLPFSEAHHFQEFVVNFDQTGKTVKEINHALLEQGIFGGKDLSSEFSESGQSTLFCVTEIHTQADIERLAAVLEEVVR